MLPDDVHALAQSGFAAKRSAALAELQSAVQNAARTTRPEALRTAAIFLAVNAARHTATIAGEEIVRACESSGTVYRKSLADDMEQSYDALVESSTGIFAAFVQNTSALGPGTGDAQMHFIQARAQGRLTAVATIHHFCERLRTSARVAASERRQSAFKIAGGAIAGVVVTKVGDNASAIASGIEWLVRHIAHL